MYSYSTTEIVGGGGWWGELEKVAIGTDNRPNSIPLGHLSMKIPGHVVSQEL